MAEETKKEKPRTLADKLVRNKQGEISLTKVGLILASVGGSFLAAPPAAIVAVIAKYIVGIGAMFTALGGLAKTERTESD